MTNTFDTLRFKENRITMHSDTSKQGWPRRKTATRAFLRRRNQRLMCLPPRTPQLPHCLHTCRRPADRFFNTGKSTSSCCLHPAPGAVTAGAVLASLRHLGSARRGRAGHLSQWPRCGEARTSASRLGRETLVLAPRASANPG